MKELTYLLYIILWEGSLMYGAYKICFEMNYSKWFLVLFVALSTAAYKPNEWIHGLNSRKHSIESEGK